VFYDKRVVPETMNWKLLVDTFHEGYHIGFLHRKSLGPILHGNVADFDRSGLDTLASSGSCHRSKAAAFH
jgi:phenylpropionate dioxygenase-like ring-hydroxylating dioxygenase large terminal subunit